jgi:hypothetical protein
LRHRSIHDRRGQKFDGWSRLATHPFELHRQNRMPRANQKGLTGRTDSSRKVTAVDTPPMSMPRPRFRSGHPLGALRPGAARRIDANNRAAAQNPGQGNAGQKTPGQKTPGQKTPGQKTPGKKHPVKKERKQLRSEPRRASQGDSPFATSR